jgi:hypothetical protein
MEQLILFCLASVGLTLIIVESKLLEPLRARLPEPWVTGIRCYQCVGVWSGLACGPLISWNPLIILCCGYAASFLSLLGAAILTRLDK